VEVPGSKSLTNRALVLAALATGPCRLENVLFADDTRHMLDALATLGLSLEIDPNGRRVTVDAPASRDFATGDAEVFCGNSGTTIRFLTALLAAAGDATFILDGVDRMRDRPIGPLVDLLRGLGGEIDFTGRDGFPPVRVTGTGLTGGQVEYPAGQTLSSQFLSAALMVAPYAMKEVRLDLAGRQVSWPYVRMTMRLMDEFGVTPEVEVTDDDARDPTAVVVPRGRYAGTDYVIEPDASAASYLLGLAAIHPGSRVAVAGLGRQNLQGDARFAEVLARMGCLVEVGSDTTVEGPASLEGIDVDLSDMPDIAQTLAVVACFAVGETTIRGLKTLRVKETDRVAALQAELAKLGAQVELEEGDNLAMTITPPPRLRRASIATYDDHRMAMSFALAATKRAGVAIEDPACVNKTYPTFFDDLSHALTRESAP
jgi:3-phosphoshikimate 1-carboxyvinyltransferase